MRGCGPLTETEPPTSGSLSDADGPSPLQTSVAAAAAPDVRPLWLRGSVGDVLSGEKANLDGATTLAEAEASASETLAEGESANFFATSVANCARMAALEPSLLTRGCEGGMD